MADTEISVLPASTTPLAGTETLPIVQGGVTKKVSVADLTAGRAVASAGGTFSDNFTQGTVAKGVNFTANTPAAGMTSQLLNWYEEGTWTPILSAGSGAVSAYGQQVGSYVRVGNLVTIQAYIALSNLGTASGDLFVSGLPFTSKNTSNLYQYGNGRINGANVLVAPASGLIGYQLAPNATILNIQKGAASGVGALQASDITNSTDFTVAITYRV